MTSGQQEQLKVVLSAELAELPALFHDLELAPPLRSYARVLFFYLKGETEKLTSACKELQRLTTGAFIDDLQAIAQVRLAFRQDNLDCEALTAFEARECEGLLTAEKWFAAAMIRADRSQYEAALGCFQKAAHVYRQHDCHKKYLRALYNAVTTESLIRPDYNYVSEWQAIVEEATRQNNLSYAGMAQNSIAREYQKIGLLDEALAMAEASIQNLTAERGSIHYFHALLHKCHLLHDLDLKKEMEPLLKECQLSFFAPIQAVNQIFACVLGGTPLPEGLSEKLLPTWKERLPELFKVPTASPESSVKFSVKLGLHEQRLVSLLLHRPREKWDLIEALYCNERGHDIEVLENRFKNLLARVRKKFPGAVYHRDGKYQISKTLAHLLPRTTDQSEPQVLS